MKSSEGGSEDATFEAFLHTVFTWARGDARSNVRHVRENDARDIFVHIERRVHLRVLRDRRFRGSELLLRLRELRPRGFEQFFLFLKERHRNKARAAAARGAVVDVAARRFARGRINPTALKQSVHDTLGRSRACGSAGGGGAGGGRPEKTARAHSLQGVWSLLVPDSRALVAARQRSPSQSAPREHATSWAGTTTATATAADGTIAETAAAGTTDGTTHRGGGGGGGVDRGGSGRDRSRDRDGGRHHPYGGGGRDAHRGDARRRDDDRGKDTRDEERDAGGAATAKRAEVRRRSDETPRREQGTLVESTLNLTPSLTLPPPPRQQPLSLEELLNKKKTEADEKAKPTFISRKEREAAALKRRQEEVANARGRRRRRRRRRQTLPRRQQVGARPAPGGGTQTRRGTPRATSGARPREGARKHQEHVHGPEEGKEKSRQAVGQVQVQVRLGIERGHEPGLERAVRPHVRRAARVRERAARGRGSQGAEKGKLRASDVVDIQVAKRSRHRNERARATRGGGQRATRRRSVRARGEEDAVGALVG